MRRLLAPALALAAIATLPLEARADLDAEDIAKARAKAAEFRARDPDLERFFQDAAGYAVFPTIGKGGFIVGGAHGDGVVFDRQGRVLGETSVTQYTFGAQIGGQAYAEIIFFETDAALADFTDGDFELSAQASAVAVTAGAGRTADYRDGVAIFTMGEKGLMLEAVVGGQDFDFEPVV